MNEIHAQLQSRVLLFMPPDRLLACVRPPQRATERIEDRPDAVDLWGEDPKNAGAETAEQFDY